MSSPEIRDAKEKAASAVERAEEIAQRGTTLADKWKEARESNNFKAMLKDLVSRGT